jgi:hypothetical protein
MGARVRAGTLSAVDVPAPAGRRLFGVPAPLVVGIVVVVVVVVAAGAGLLLRGGAASPGCTDQKRAGLVPELERRVPATFDGRAADQLDSSITCSAEGLGSLAGHGIGSVDSAGGLWDLGPSTGITLAVFRLPGADGAEQIAEFYETGALQARKVSGLTTTRPTVAGRPGTRLDYADASFPGTIVVWPAAEPGLVNVVLAAGVPDRVVEEGIGAFGGR